METAIVDKGKSDQFRKRDNPKNGNKNPNQIKYEWAIKAEQMFNKSRQVHQKSDMIRSYPHKSEGAIKSMRAQAGLHSLIELISGDSCLIETFLFNVQRDHFVILAGSTMNPAIKHVIRPIDLEIHMRTPTIIPFREFIAKLLQMCKAFDDEHMIEPFILQCFDHSLGHSN